MSGFISILLATTWLLRTIHQPSDFAVSSLTTEKQVILKEIDKPEYTIQWKRFLITWSNFPNNVHSNSYSWHWLIEDCASKCTTAGAVQNLGGWGYGALRRTILTKNIEFWSLLLKFITHAKKLILSCMSDAKTSKWGHAFLHNFIVAFANIVIRHHGAYWGLGET